MNNNLKKEWLRILPALSDGLMYFILRGSIHFHCYNKISNIFKVNNCLGHQWQICQKVLTTELRAVMYNNNSVYNNLRFCHSWILIQLNISWMLFQSWVITLTEVLNVSKSSFDLSLLILPWKALECVGSSNCSTDFKVSNYYIDEY